MIHHKYMNPSLFIERKLEGELIITNLSVNKNVEHYKSIRKHYYGLVHRNAVRTYVKQAPEDGVFNIIGLCTVTKKLTIAHLMNADTVSFRFSEYGTRKKLGGFTITVDGKEYYEPKP